MRGGHSGQIQAEGSPCGLKPHGEPAASVPAWTAWRAFPEERHKSAGCPLTGYLAEPVSRFAPLLPLRTARVDVWDWEQVTAVGQSSVDRKEPVDAHGIKSPTKHSCSVLRNRLPGFKSLCSRRQSCARATPKQVRSGLSRRRGDCRWLSVAECELGADGLGISVVYVVENG